MSLPVGHVVFIKAQLLGKSFEHSRLLERNSAVDAVQAEWFLLSCCAATRPNYWLKTVRLELPEEFATEHDRYVWRRLAKILDV